MLKTLLVELYGIVECNVSYFCGNNSINNLKVLCPNCHAMTENYMALNKGYSARDKRYKGGRNQKGTGSDC